MIFKVVSRSICLASLVLLLLPVNGRGGQIAGVNFSESLIAGEVELRLHGLALLKWARLFDVYAGAFYLPEGSAGTDWSEDIPKRLELSYFRHFAAGDFVKSSDKMLRDNLTVDAYLLLEERLATFYGLFQDISPKDRYSLVYLPDVGTELRLNDEVLGMVPGADFALAYFGIWLGEKPIDRGFRDRLLDGR